MANRIRYSHPRPYKTLGVTLGCGSVDPRVKQEVISDRAFIEISVFRIPTAAD